MGFLLKILGPKANKNIEDVRENGNKLANEGIYQSKIEIYYTVSNELEYEIRMYVYVFRRTINYVGRQTQ